MSARTDYPWLADMADLRGDTSAIRALKEIDWLRAECKAWMNGVADAVEPLGYNREAACGPADLLPGLDTLVAEVESLKAISGRSGIG